MGRAFVSQALGKSDLLPADWHGFASCKAANGCSKDVDALKKAFSEEKIAAGITIYWPGGLRKLFKDGYKGRLGFISSRLNRRCSELYGRTAIPFEFQMCPK